MSKYRYFRVEDETMAATCRSWRRRWEAGRQAANDFASSMNATGIRTGLKDELVGLDMATIPDGWKRANARNGGIYPANGPKGASARAALAALPPMPGNLELAQMIGHGSIVSYKGTDVSGSTGVGGLYPVQLIWDGDDMALVVADPESVIVDILTRHPNAEIEGRWSPPAGLVEITKAQWDLIVAQNAVARETAAA